jgi:hypothetical protein
MRAAKIMEQIPNNAPFAYSELNDFAAELWSCDEDWAWPGSGAALDPEYLDDYFMNPYLRNASDIGIGVVSRYPSKDDLPDCLPEDIDMPRAFGPNSALKYERTELGFRIYSEHTYSKNDKAPEYDADDLYLIAPKHKGGDFRIYFEYDPVNFYIDIQILER